MSYKWIGAVLVIVGCGGFGCLLAANHRKEEQGLRQLIRVLDYMVQELQYRLTPLPELCRQAGKETRGALREVFLNLARELDWQIAPDAASCMRTALSRSHSLPVTVRELVKQLGATLGHFELEGQLQGLEAVREDCCKALARLEADRDARLRSYQTLGFCAGAALAILLL